MFKTFMKILLLLYKTNDVNKVKQKGDKVAVLMTFNFSMSKV